MATQTDNRNYYEVLHVSRDAPPQIIRASYRTLMQQLKHHPDLGGDTATASLINEAYAVLSDEERRAEYDAMFDILMKVADGVAGISPTPESPSPFQQILDPLHECVFCLAPHNRGKTVEADVNCISCGSPLSSAENYRFEWQGQRAVGRIGKRQAITFYTRWPQQKGYSGYTEDISLNGLRFSTRQNLAEGQRIKIVSEFVEAIAHVTHCNYERQAWTTWCIAGVSFVTLRFINSVGGFVCDQA